MEGQLADAVEQRLDARRVKKVVHKKFGVESPEVHESIFNTQNRFECPSKN